MALVTGAGQGVGTGIARALAAQGAAVVVNDLYQERAQTTVDSITSAGGTASVCTFDVSDYDTVDAAISHIHSTVGPIDILVNNAGVPIGMAIQQFKDSEPSEWSKYIDLNLFGVLNCCRAVINSMRDREYGRIITISSGAGTQGIALGVSPYAAGKGGALSFMRHLAIENARVGVTANCVALGLMGGGGDPDATAHIAKTIPVKRLGTPDDVGAICVYLASGEASWMTGQTIELNGGSHTT